MEEEAPSNLLARILVDDCAGLSLTALAQKLQLSHNSRLVAVYGSSEGQQTLKVVRDKPFLCILCGACFTHTTQLRCHAQAKHGYGENASSAGSLAYESNLDLRNFRRRASGPSTNSGGDEGERRPDDAEFSPKDSDILKTALTGDDDESSLFPEVARVKVKKEYTSLSDGEVEDEGEAGTGELPKCLHCDKSFVSQEKLFQHEFKYCGKDMHKCFPCRNAYLPPNNTHPPRTTTSAEVSDESATQNQQYLLNSGGSNFNQECSVGPGDASGGESSKAKPEVEDGQGIDCVMCGETFGILQHMITHIHAYTSFPCTFCDSEYPSMRDLGWHCKQKHDLLLVRCPFCSRGFREYSHLAFHMREHKGHLFCRICKVQSLSLNSYTTHMESHRIPDDDDYSGSGLGDDLQGEDDDDSNGQKEKDKQVCHICSQTFNSFYSIFHHFRREHPSESLPSYNQDLIKRRFVCKKCGFAFRRKDTLERHELIHKRGQHPRRKPPARPIVKPRPGTIMCLICDRAFMRPSNLEAHMEQAHPDECDDNVKGKKKYCCDLCGKLLMSQKSLDRHILVHEEPKFTCPICDKKLRHAETLKTHMRTHTGEKPYVCDICNQSFAQRSTYVQHMCIHSGERHHSCEICNKKFFRKTELKIHLAKHTTSRSFPCNFCSKSFKTEKHRRVHESQLHATNTPSYMCEKCGKSFTWASGLKAHACSHQGDAPYKCQECSKSFSQPLFLKRHMQVHTKPFKCEDCYEGFRSKTDLRNHVLQAHGPGTSNNQVQSMVPSQVQDLIQDHSWKPNRMMMDMNVEPDGPLTAQLPGPLSGPTQQAPLQGQLQTTNQSQMQSSHSPQVQVQGNLLGHVGASNQNQNQTHMGQIPPSMSNAPQVSSHHGHSQVPVSLSNHAPMSLPIRSPMSLPNQPQISHPNQPPMNHPNQAQMNPPQNQSRLPHPNQGPIPHHNQAPMSLPNRGHNPMSLPNHMTNHLPNQPPMSRLNHIQMSHPNHNPMSLQPRVQVSLHNQLPNSLPNQGQVSLPRHMQGPLPGPHPGHPQHPYLQDPMMQDRSLFGDPQFQVQESNQTIAAMLTQMSSL